MKKRKPEQTRLFELPDTTDLASVSAAEVEVIRLATQRRLSPREALHFSRMLELRRRAIGDVELEERLERIEQENRRRRRNGS